MQKMNYKGRKVEVVRLYRVLGKLYADVRELATGKVINSIRFSNNKLIEKEKTKGKEKVKELVEEKKPEKEEKKPIKIVVKNDKAESVFVYPSPEFDKFVKTNELNKNMIDNCVHGKQKTHKGYTFSLV